MSFLAESFSLSNRINRPPTPGRVAFGCLSMLVPVVGIGANLVGFLYFWHSRNLGGALLWLFVVGPLAITLFFMLVTALVLLPFYLYDRFVKRRPADEKESR